MAPYGEGPKRIAVMDALLELWAPFDVGITDERPLSGDYAMVVVTPTNPLGGGVLGVAGEDCGDANPRSVGLAFAGSNDALSAEITAIAISHSAGRGYGLENVEGEAIMGGFAIEGAQFVDECLTLLATPLCPGHVEHCPEGQQNSFEELSTLFPPR